MLLKRLLLGVFLPAAVYAQANIPSGIDDAAHGTAITGIPSSAKHCLSGNTANVHNLGWVAAQSRYTVQFDADFAVTAAITRFEPTENRASLIDGNPEFNGTAASSGTMVLHVSGNGQSGCYRRGKGRTRHREAGQKPDPDDGHLRRGVECEAVRRS
jgi:hypothetical protein